MFGNMFKKKAAELKAGMSKMENKDLMEGILAGAVLVMNSNGHADDDEFIKLQGIIEANDNLKHFGPAIGATLDKYCDMYKAGARLAKAKLMKEIVELNADVAQKEEAFIICIEIADSDNEIDEQELACLHEIGKALGLKPETYI